MKNLISNVTLLLVLNFTYAQSLSPTVLSTSGAFYANSTGMLSSTIGELAMVETFSNSSAILTQGFQQFFDTVTGINETFAHNHFSIFPNPTSGNVNIQISNENTGKANIFVFDAIGKLVFKQTENITGQVQNIKLSMHHLSNGLYHLQIKNNTENYYTKFNLIK